LNKANLNKLVSFSGLLTTQFWVMKTWRINTWCSYRQRLTVCLRFVDLMLLHVTRSPSPSIFAYCKWSVIGAGNGLGMRLE